MLNPWLQPCNPRPPSSLRPFTLPSLQTRNDPETYPMSIFSKLFGGGGGSKTEAAPEQHGDYRIFVAPTSEQGGFRVTARIEKDVEGETKTHLMIRADKCQSLEEAQTTSLLKAKMLIDQQGDLIFR